MPPPSPESEPHHPPNRLWGPRVPLAPPMQKSGFCLCSVSASSFLPRVCARAGISFHRWGGWCFRWGGRWRRWWPFRPCRLRRPHGPIRGCDAAKAVQQGVCGAGNGRWWPTCRDGRPEAPTIAVAWSRACGSASGTFSLSCGFFPPVLVACRFFASICQRWDWVFSTPRDSKVVASCNRFSEGRPPFAFSIFANSTPARRSALIFRSAQAF